MLFLLKDAMEYSKFIGYVHEMHVLICKKYQNCNVSQLIILSTQHLFPIRLLAPYYYKNLPGECYLKNLRGIPFLTLNKVYVFSWLLMKQHVLRAKC